MLLKFNAIEEIGRFAKLKHKGEQFSQLSLIYARNGYGKSTLCAILRSASEEEPNHIHARRRLTAKAESRVQSSWASGTTIAFGGGKWNACPGKIHIFDQEFVHRNLHVGESVTRENKRSLLPLVLGAPGVELSEKITDLDREQRDLDVAMRKHSSVILAKCPVVSQNTLLEFCLKEIPPNLPKQIESSARTVALAKQSATVKQKKNPRVFELETIDYYREIALRTISSMSGDVAQRIQSHIRHHRLEPNGDKWLKYGIEHLQGDKCPFCNNSIAGLDLIDAYRTYFSEAFGKLITDRDNAIAVLRESERIDNITALVDSNNVDFEFWNPVCELNNFPQMSLVECTTIATGLSELRRVLEQKIANPLAAISFRDSAEEIEAEFSLLSIYNAGIEKSILVINEARSTVGTIDLTLAQTNHQKWCAMEEKEKEPVKSEVAQYTKASARKKAIEAEKRTAQENLIAYAKRTIGARQGEINSLLEDFGTNFRIVDTRANFVGRDPNTEFAVEVDGMKIKMGEKSDTEPSFKTVLSAGDKTTLALAFFIAQVRADQEINSAVVVFDDPFSSQDMNRQFETTSQIRSVADFACQTIVLSHDPRFLHSIEKDANTSITKSFQLLCSDNGEGLIAQWSSADELKEIYIRQSEMIREFSSHSSLLKDTTYLSIIQAIRPFLESYIKARYPGRFSENEMLSRMITVIKEAGADDPLYDSVTDLLALNECTRPYMHGGDSGVPDPVALRAQCKKIIRIVGKY